jgi:alkanesulfonate monooxygenase SsuD/methylene tetrahydromethanopterin reductase-like flavin-dependent oxidoreductase (luciferase family)
VSVSIGIAGATPLEVVRAIAPRVEALGFHGLWINDTPTGDSLAGLAVAAEVTTTLALGTGVIPVDRVTASAILERAERLPADRLTIGIGSGQARHPLALVERAVLDLRAATAASVMVGALGPRMRELAARVADGPLLNWLTPAATADAMGELRRDSVGRPVRGVIYVRTAVDDDALPALESEAARYAGYPQYAANLERIGATAMQATIHGDVRAGIASFAAVADEVVLRVITRDSSLEALEHFVDAAAAVSP